MANEAYICEAVILTEAQIVAHGLVEIYSPDCLIADISGTYDPTVENVAICP